MEFKEVLEKHIQEKSKRVSSDIKGLPSSLFIEPTLSVSDFIDLHNTKILINKKSKYNR